MQKFWALGQLHGDFSLRNILCDTRARTLSIVDVDVTAKPFVSSISKDWYPASYDLAGMLYDFGIDLKSPKLGVLLRKRTFVESAVRAFLTTAVSFRDKLRLLEEIRGYARAELNALDVSCSPIGFYHLLQRRVASRRIDRLLARVLPGAG